MNIVCHTVLMLPGIGRLPAFSLFPQSSEDKTLLSWFVAMELDTSNSGAASCDFAGVPTHKKEAYELIQPACGKKIVLNKNN